MPLNAVVGDLYIVNGARQPEMQPAASLVPPRGAAHGRAGDRLFVLVELHSDDPGSPLEPSSFLYAKLIDQLSTSYWHTKGSVTAALREAISSASNWLMDYNLESPVGARLNAGVSCVTLREADVFIAQAGPSNCFVAHQGQVERFPGRSTSLVLPPLGSSRGCEIRYGHAELHHGDVVLLCDSATAERLSDETVTKAIVYVGAPAAIASLERLAGEGNLFALLIEVTAEAETTSLEPPAVPAPALPPASSAPAPMEMDQEPAATPREAGPSLGERLGEASSRLREAVGGVAQALPPAALQERVRQVGQSVALGLLVAGRNAGELFRRILPERGPSKRAEREAPLTMSTTLIMVGLVILIPLLITMVVFDYWTERQRQADFELQLNLAREQVALAQTSPDPQAVRMYWQTAWQHTDLALGYKPDDLDTVALREQVRGQLDQIDRVTRVRSAFLMDFGPGSAYSLALQGANVFVMNTTSLWHVTLNETGSGLLESQSPAATGYTGASVGERQIGTLLDLAWVSAYPPRTKSSLLILDAGGLLEYDPAWNIRAVALGQGGLRPGMHLMDTFGGNLYILDNSQLWRYKPVGAGFGDLPEPYFNSSPGDLTPVIDMAIDGSIYLLYSNGHIRKFFGGDEQTFTPTDLPEPLARPVALAVDAESAQGGIYVADVDQASVMQLTPQGIFVRQIKTLDKTMDALESIVVDESAQRLLFISGGKLYAVVLTPARSP
ncbi:MAG: hypothetical protein JW850_23575 [Thermoflexales bacterium]|nr:hypothetical protein [Thermoflexales bacterium]